MPQFEIKAPDGTVYHWDKPNPPTQADFDAIQAYHAQTHPAGKPLARPASNGDPLGDPADAPDYRPPAPLPKAAPIGVPVGALTGARVGVAAKPLPEASKAKLAELAPLQERHRQAMRGGDKKKRVAAKAAYDAVGKEIARIRAGGNPFDMGGADEGAVAMRELRTAQDDMTPEMAAYLGELATSAVPKAFKRASSTISKAIGNGPVDPSVYDNRAPLNTVEGASRALARGVDFAQYLVPGVNVPALAGQALSTSAGLATDPMAVVKGLVQGLNFAEPGIDPEERFFRLANLGLTVVGGLHGKAMISDAVAAQKLATARGLHLDVAMEAVKAARTTQAHYNAKEVAKLGDATRSEALRRGEGQARPVPGEPVTPVLHPSKAQSLAELGAKARPDASGLAPVDPLASLSYPVEPTAPKPGIKGKTNVKKSGPPGEPPRLIGEQGEPAEVLLPDGQPMFRSEADRSRLAAMVEEFGPEQGRARYVSDRMAPERPVHLITGDEMTRTELDALKGRVERLKQDREALDRTPQLPPDARERFVRTFDPDTLDPYADHPADDATVTTAHMLLFGEAPPRDSFGEVTPGARERIMNEVIYGQEADYRARVDAEEAAAPAYATDYEHLAYLSGAKRRSKPRNFIPDGPPAPNRRVSTPEDVISARSVKGGWRYHPGKVNMVGMDQVAPDIARQVIEYAKGRESDHFLVRRGEVQRFTKAGGEKPTFRKMSEWIEKEVGSDWERPDFDRWGLVQVPQKVVAEFMVGQLVKMKAGREFLQERLPDLTPEEINDVIEHYARGGESPDGPGTGNRRPLDLRGEDADLGQAPGDRYDRPDSPREPERQRLDRELSELETRIARARLMDDAPANLVRPGEPEGPAPKLLGPDGKPVEPAPAKPTKKERAKAKEKPQAAPVAEPAPKIEAAPSTPTKARTEPTKVEAKPEKPAPAEPEKPAARNEDRNAAREERGADPLESDAPRPRVETETKAKARLDRNPDASHALAERIVDKPRPISDAETALLQEGYERLVTRAEEIQRDLADGKGDASALATEYEAIKSKLDVNDQAMRRGGTEVARALAARRRRLVDYSKPETVLADARAAGTFIDPATDRKIRQLSREVAEGRTREESLQADLDRLRGTDDKSAAAEAVKRGGNPRRAREEIKAEREQAWTEFYRATSGQANFLGSFNAEAGRALRKVADLYIEEGVASLSELVDKVRAQIESKGGALLGDGQSPDGVADGAMVLHERDLYAAVAGRFEEAAVATPDAATAQTNRLRTLAGIVTKMHDVLEGTYPDRSPQKVADAQVSAMRNALAKLRKIKGFEDLPAADPAKVYAERIQKALHDLAYGPEEKGSKIGDAPETPEIKAKRERLEDIRRRARERWGETGEQRARKQIDRAEAELARELAKLNGGYRDLTDAPKVRPATPDELAAARKSLADVRQRLKIDDRISELERRLRDKDFAAVEAEDAARVKDRERQVAQRSKELEEARVARFDAERKVREAVEIAKAEQRNRERHFVVKVAREVGGLFNGAFRTLQTSLDLSGPRQASKLLPYTYRTAPKNLAQMVRSFGSDRIAKGIEYELREGRANADLYRSSGLHFNELDGSDALSEIEKTFSSQLIGKAPLVKGSERSYASLLNLVRADAFDLMAKNAEAVTGRKLTKEEYRSIAKGINILTGRGSGKLADGLGELGAIGFAPRFEWSKWQTLKGDPFMGASPAVRMEMAKAYGGFISTGLTIMLLCQMSGAKVGWNPKADNFGKIGFGDYEYDVWAGGSGAARLIAQFLGGKIDRRGNKTAVSPYLQANIVGKYMTQKLGPVPRAAAAVVTGKVDGKKVSYGADLGYEGNFWTALAGPLSLKGLAEGYRKEGVVGVAKASPDLVGVGTSVLGKN